MIGDRDRAGGVFECVKFALHARLSRRGKRRRRRRRLRQRWRRERTTGTRERNAFVRPPTLLPGVKMFLLNFKLTDVYFTRNPHTRRSHYIIVCTRAVKFAGNIQHPVFAALDKHRFPTRRVLNFLFSSRFPRVPITKYNNFRHDVFEFVPPLPLVWVGRLDRWTEANRMPSRCKGSVTLHTAHQAFARRENARRHKYFNRSVIILCIYYRSPRRSSP